MRLFLAALLVFAGFAAYPGGAAYADVPVPPLQSRVTDLTGTLNAQQKSELESRIAAFESKRGSQIAVLMLPSTKPEEIEQYAIRVAEAWKIGRKKVDDGLILVVAKDDRRLRIEVGYGLEGAIPDSVAKRVIDERITPRFRNGDFYGGVRDGVDQLIRLAEGEKLPAPAPAAAANTRQEPISFLRYFAGNPMFIFILTLAGGAILKAFFGRLPGSLAIAAGVGLLVLLLYGIGIAILAAFAAFIVTFTNTGGARSGGGWSSGGGASGGGSWGGGSSSSGGGGFSGGGGSFGGGGASGRW